jgi:predicted DNA-binding transcriptional regulator YafY
MAYSKMNLEVHSMIAGIHEKYGRKGFIHFNKAPELKGAQYIEPIIGAIERKEVLRITYLPFYEDKPYFNEVHPYLLKEHGFRWYLVAWNQFREQLRTYALDRIRDLKAAPGVVYRPPGFNTADYFKYSIGIISPAGAPAQILLAVQKTQAQYLITQPWHESQNIHAEDPERVIFSFRVHPTYEFKSMVLGLGTDGEILEPVALREELCRELELMLEHYRER